MDTSNAYDLLQYLPEVIRPISTSSDSIVLSLVLWIPALSFSLIFFCANQVIRSLYKKTQYGKFRYKKVLLTYIFAKSFIVAPFVWWLLDLTF